MIKFWASILIRGKQEGYGGAIRLLCIAKHIDKNGGSLILEPELRKFCLSNGVKDRTYRRWFSDAVDIGFLRHTRDDRYYMMGRVEACQLLGLRNLGARPSELPIEKLISPGWYSHVYAGWLSNHKNPMSRRKKRELTGIPETTQKVLEKKAGVVTTANYARSDLDNKLIEGIREFELRNGVFAGRDGVMFRLPNSSTTVVQQGSRGRTKKMQRELNHSLKKRQVTDRFLRIYHDDYKQVRATVKHINKLDITGVPDLYLRVQQGENTAIWVHAFDKYYYHKHYFLVFTICNGS